MNQVKNFNDLLTAFKAKHTHTSAVIVSPNDEHTQYVVRRAVEEKLLKLILVLDGGESPELQEFCAEHPQLVTTIQCPDTEAAAQKGVSLIYNKEAHVLMKGSLNTDTLLHAVIDKKGGKGLLAPNSVMSHITLVEAPEYHKMLMFSDAAVLPYPNLEQFKQMCKADVSICHRMGIANPKVALVHFSEKSNPRFPVTDDYKQLITLSQQGFFGQCEMAGPMDVKTACDSHSAQIKKISSPVVGDADLLIMPDLEAGNVFYKTVSLFGKAKMAGLITGTTSPVVVASRADSAESKFFSLILACLVA